MTHFLAWKRKEAFKFNSPYKEPNNGQGPRSQGGGQAWRERGGCVEPARNNPIYPRENEGKLFR